MQIGSWGDSLHKMSSPVFWEKVRKLFVSLSSAELAQRVVKVKMDCVFSVINYDIVKSEQLYKQFLIVYVVIDMLYFNL